MRNETTRKALEKLYDQKRAETLSKIQIAINELRTTGEKITISKLVKITGLSNAVFYKEHVQELLRNEPEWYRASKAKGALNSYEILEKSNFELSKQLELEKSKKQDVMILLERKNGVLEKYKTELEEKDKELELLRGKYHALFTMIEQIKGFEGLDIDIL